jgi:hypothetical protein
MKRDLGRGRGPVWVGDNYGARFVGLPRCADLGVGASLALAMQTPGLSDDACGALGECLVGCGFSDRRSERDMARIEV